MTIKDDFAEKLRLLRGERGLSQVDLANLTGIAPAQLSRYELGKSYPRAEIMAKLASALGVDRRELSTKGLERAVSVHLPHRLIGKLVEASSARTDGEMVGRDEMTDEVRARLEESFERYAPGVSGPEMAALAARLQVELAEEQFKNHALIVKLSQVAEMLEDDLNELETYADEHDLKLDDFGIDEWDWRKIISEYRYADRWLEQEAKKYEDQLKQAMEARDRSLKELRERIERRNAAVHGNATEESATPSDRMKFDHTTEKDK